MIHHAFVEPDGLPVACGSREDAINLLLEKADTRISVIRDPEKTITRELQETGKFCFEHLQRHSSPFFCAIHEGSFLPEDLVNGHVTHRPKSRAYIEQAIHARMSFADPAPGDMVLLRSGKIGRLGCRIDANSFSVYQARGEASFWIAHDGMTIPSGGGLGFSSIERKSLVAHSEDMKLAEFWFFLDGETGPGRGIYIQLPVRIWSESSFPT